MKIDPVTLRSFIAIVEEGSIARAAIRVHLAPSAVSKRIAELESHLHTQLLIRKNRGIEPTVAGRSLVRHARNILHGLDELVTEIRDFSSGIRGRVRLFANISSITQFLPHDLKSFLTQHPGIDIDLEEHISSFTTRAVAENAADIGIYAQADNEYGLEVFPYRRDQLVLAVPYGHKLSRRRVIKFVDTLDHEFVGYHKGGAINYLLLRAASDANRTLKLRFQVTTFEAVFAMVRAGLGIGVLPAGTIGLLGREPGLRTIRLADAWASRQIKLCVRNRNSLPAAAALLVTHLLSEPDALPAISYHDGKLAK
ncbi:MAG: LysR family transcriptional regulator [Betaproteobacteria bacterium RIFCSPLOWO2_12_FULL_62_58]|nr:MAG: LysR family transcriptional regulator [Betaproteobacteria bacterium RIFCSPLOWO2_12_FULL_62_58]